MLFQGSCDQTILFLLTSIHNRLAEISYANKGSKAKNVPYIKIEITENGQLNFTYPD